MVKVEYVTDEQGWHFASVYNSKKAQVFLGKTKREVKQKVVSWVQEHMPNVPLWKIRFNASTIADLSQQSLRVWRLNFDARLFFVMLNNQMTLGEIYELALEEIEKLVEEKK